MTVGAGRGGRDEDFVDFLDSAELGLLLALVDGYGTRIIMSSSSSKVLEEEGETTTSSMSSIPEAIVFMISYDCRLGVGSSTLCVGLLKSKNIFVVCAIKMFQILKIGVSPCVKCVSIFL